MVWAPGPQKLSSTGRWQQARQPEATFPNQWQNRVISSTHGSNSQLVVSPAPMHWLNHGNVHQALATQIRGKPQTQMLGHAVGCNQVGAKQGATTHGQTRFLAQENSPLSPGGRPWSHKMVCLQGTVQQEDQSFTLPHQVLPREASGSSHATTGKSSHRPGDSPGHPGNPSVNETPRQVAPATR